jgi:uncharacterized protein (TIGR02594 family)
MSPLTLHDRGTDVTRVQLLLNSHLPSDRKLTVDGVFGGETQKAVVEFQRRAGLVADGVVGEKTLAALGQRQGPRQANTVAAGSTAWLDIARAELGVHEFGRPGAHNDRILEYHATTTLGSRTDETPWCSSFVNWVVIQSGRRGTNDARAKSWLDWGTPVSTPVPGAVVVIKKKTAGFTNATGSASGYHVGFFVSETPTHVRILGGNQADRVKYSDFPLHKYDVKGYRM